MNDTRKKNRYKQVSCSSDPPQKKTGGEVKPVIIGIITVSLIIILLLVGLYVTDFVGKAIVGGNEVDMVLVGQDVDFKFNLPTARTNGLYFELTSTDIDVCTDLTFTYDLNMWDDYLDTNTATCTNNRLYLGDATLDDTAVKTGEFVVGKLAPTGTFPATFTLHLDHLDLYDISSGLDLFPDPDDYTFTISTHSLCGNGVLDAGETCEDGNTVDNDGCSATCQDEDNTVTCGNSILEIGETCDDGNANIGDGCSDVCLVENGYTCTAVPSVCTRTSCGPQGTACDDNNECVGFTWEEDGSKQLFLLVIIMINVWVQLTLLMVLLAQLAVTQVNVRMVDVLSRLV